jgi:hypothetical protein
MLKSAMKWPGASTIRSVNARSYLGSARRAFSPMPWWPLPEAQFLLRGLAFSRSDLPATPLESARERARWPRIEDRVVWLVDLFERLERSKSNAGHAEG